MQRTYNGQTLPTDGEPIDYKDGQFTVPDHPIIPFIEGDGTGRDIWRAAQRVFDAAVEKAYGGKRAIRWFEIFAGEKAFRKFQSWLPDDTVAAARDLHVSIKGPLTTPVGGGIRSLNVALRQILDLYCCVRPVKYYPGVPSPVKHPEKLDIVIFRENTEDVYAGIEFQQGSEDAARLISFLNDDLLKGGHGRCFCGRSGGRSFFSRRPAFSRFASLGLSCRRRIFSRFARFGRRCVFGCFTRLGRTGCRRTLGCGGR